MSQADSVFLTLGVVLSAFVIVTVVLQRRYPGHAYLPWMIAAIAVIAAGLASGAFIEKGSTQVLVVVICFTAGAAFTTRTVMLLGASERVLPVTLLPAVLLSAATIAADRAAIPFVYGTVPFHIAVAILLFEGGLCIFRRASVRFIDISIAACMLASAAVFAFRGAGFMAVFDASTPYAEIEASRYNVVTILAMAAAGLTNTLLVVLRLLDAAATRYRAESRTDPLTGLLNRNAFVAECERRGPNAFLVICDIDRFKRINDTWGHKAGDDVICALAGLMRDIGVTAGRMGGEEFAMLLRQADSGQARLFAEGMRTAFSLLTVDGLPRGEALSASFGVAAFRADDSFDACFCRADAALYEAKRTGRNKVVLASLRSLYETAA